MSATLLFVFIPVFAVVAFLTGAVIAIGAISMNTNQPAKAAGDEEAAH